MKFAILALISVATATVPVCSTVTTVMLNGDTCTCADIAKPDTCLTALYTKFVSQIKAPVLTAAEKKAEAKAIAHMTPAEKAEAKKALAR